MHSGIQALDEQPARPGSVDEACHGHEVAKAQILCLRIRDEEFIKMKQLKLSCVAAITCLSTAAVLPATAFAAGPDAVYGSPWPTSFGPYQNPDGSYPSYVDFYRSLAGVPCGIECRQSAERRNVIQYDSGYYGLYNR